MEYDLDSTSSESSRLSTMVVTFSRKSGRYSRTVHDADGNALINYVSDSMDKEGGKGAPHSQPELEPVRQTGTGPVETGNSPVENCGN